MSTAPFLSRHLGDYLLVAQLSEDALGTVFRALYAPDERRFVRLRILQSEELCAEALVAAIRDFGQREPMARHDAIVRRPQLDFVEGFPILAWDEIAGWTLDAMLGRVRAFGIRIPAEYALLIAERIAAGLEHAHQSVAGERPSEHGLLWPGFVAIAHDASVRIGGFGIAQAVYPSLSGPRLSTEIAPYVAPEARGGGRVTPSGDVYSLGAILVELITGRRPSLDTPSAELRAGDPRSDDLGAFLRRCLADPAERFASAADAHRALQQMVTGNPFSLYTANLALFLYKLLNPESQSVAPSSDWESTNPVFVEKTVTRSTSGDIASKPPLEEPRRRKGDLDPSELPASDSPAPVAAEVAVAVGVAVAEPLDPAPVPAPLQEHAASLMQGSRPIRWPAILPAAWRRPTAGLAAAAGLGLGVFLLASQLPARRPAPPTDSAAGGVQPISPTPAPAFEPFLDTVAAEAFEAASAAAGSFETAANPHPASAPRPAKRVRAELRQPAEDLRLRAALARIEADRVNAREKAAKIFGEGQQSEEEGERLMRTRDYDAAQLAFSRAASLFQKAQEITWDERVRAATLSANP